MKMLLTLLLIWTKVGAAPMPVTSSSVVISPNWGKLVSDHGFQLDSRNTGWSIHEGVKEDIYVIAYFKGIEREKGKTPILTVRLDEVRNTKKPQTYLNQWTLLYQRLGYEIKNPKRFTQQGHYAFSLDLLHKAHGVKQKQKIFLNGSKAVLLTCSDEEGYFESTEKVCDKIMNSFKWD